MSDLVKRLKAKRTPVYHGNFQDGHWEDDKDCQEAAAEIKRLTSALESSRSDTILEMVRLSFPAGPGAPSAKERGRRIGLEEYREALRQKLFETQT